MSEKIFEDNRYLCNDFPNMEKANYMYKYIKERQPIEKEDLEKNIPFEINNSLRTLDITGLTIREGKGISIENTPTIIKFLDLNDLTKFKLHFLYSLRKRTVEDEGENGSRWSNQSHVLLQYKIMIENNLRYFEVNNKTVIDMLITELKKGNYEPTNRRNNKIQLNEKKLRYWKCICDFIGLTSPGNTLHKSILTMDPDIFYSILKCCFKNKKEIDFRDLINFIDKKFILFPLDMSVSPPKVYPVFSEIFNYLDVYNKITLKEEGDAYTHQLENVRGKNKFVNRVRMNE